MKHIVKTMADGQANEIEVEAETHEAAVMLLAATFCGKNRDGELMSETVTIYSKSGCPEYTIQNRLSDAG